MKDSVLLVKPRNKQIHIKSFCHRVLCWFLLSSTLIACQSTNTTKHSPFIDTQKFAQYQTANVETVDEIFRLKQNAYDFVDKVTANKSTEQEKVSALVQAIFDSSSLSMRYQTGANSVAQNSFENARANCLSLTIMTYAMTEYLGIDSTFQRVIIPEYWTRRDGSSLINQHVNLRVFAKKPRPYISSYTPLVLDFDPLQNTNKFAIKDLSKQQIVSYFYANKGAEYLIENSPGKALSYFSAAIEYDQNNEGAWLNLGVLYAQHGFYDDAESFYGKALELKPNYSAAHENLALLFQKIGEHEKAQVLLAKLHKKRSVNPYYHMMLGDIDFENKQYNKAITHYSRALSLNKRIDEFHFSMAKTYFALGDIKNTKKYLQNAHKRASDDGSRERYSSKMSLLANQI